MAKLDVLVLIRNFLLRLYYYRNIIFIKIIYNLVNITFALFYYLNSLNLFSFLLPLSRSIEGVTIDE